LVNWLRALDKYKAIDFRLEHLNRNYKIEMKYYKNFIYDIDIIFNRVCLSNITVKILHSKIEYIFGKEMSNAHMWAEADLNMFTLAQNLYSGNLVILWQPAQLAGLRLFNFHNIFSTGVEILVKKVNKFN